MGARSVWIGRVSAVVVLCVVALVFGLLVGVRTGYVAGRESMRLSALEHEAEIVSRLRAGEPADEVWDELRVMGAASIALLQRLFADGGWPEPLPWLLFGWRPDLERLCTLLPEAVKFYRQYLEGFGEDALDGDLLDNVRIAIFSLRGHCRRYGVGGRPSAPAPWPTE